MACDHYLWKILGVPDARFAGAAAKPQYSPDKNFRTLHVRIALDIDVDKKTVGAECTTTLKSLNGKPELSLDAKDFKAVSVKVNNKPVKHKYDGSKIEITVKANPDDILTVAVKYKLTAPKLGIYFVGPDKHYPKKAKQVWSHSESEDTKYWFPTQDVPDNKSTSETVITVPNTFTVVSNGALLKVTENKTEKRKTFHWKMSKPHSPYLISFATGEFDEVKDNWRGVPVTYYCEKGRADEIKRAFAKTPQMMEFFSKKIGVKYQYEKYAQVAVIDFIFGGMEHTTCTTQTDTVLHDEKAHEEVQYSADGLAAHELAHQWFGDLLTCKDWSHIWLNEAFATYFDALFQREDKGEEYFQWDMHMNALSYLAEDKDKYRRPIVTNMFRRSNDLVDRHTYQKGACVLRMLHETLGDELWWKTINHYVERNKNKSVETLDFIEAIEEATGKNMKKFCDQWIFGAGHPEYKVLYHWDGKDAVIRISQNPELLFSAKIKIELTTKNGVRRFEELIDGKEHQFRYKTDEPVMVRIDPDNMVLKKMEVSKPMALWTYQLEFDPNPVGRMQAAAAVARAENGTERDAEILGKAMLKEKFWGVQAEIAALLGHMRNRKSVEYLKKGLALHHPLARRAVITALGAVKDPMLVKDIKHLLDDKNSYAVPAEVCRTLGKTKDPSVEPMLHSMLNRESWTDVVRAGAVEGLAHLHGAESLDLLMKYASPGNHERTRMLAIRHIGFYGKGHKKALDFLMEATKDSYTLIQLAAVGALGLMQDERTIPVLEEFTKEGHDGRVQRVAEDVIKSIYPWLETDMETYRKSKALEKKEKD